MTVKYAMLSALALCGAQALVAETHSVTFRRMNGTVLSKIEVEHGANASGLVPALPAEADMTARTWDCADRLASVTNDVTCWALYEASTAKSPSTSIASQSVVDRTTPYSLEEYFQIYDNLAWSDEFSGTSLSVASYSWFSNGKNWLYDTEQRNGELQKYTTTGGNHIVSDGTLKLRAKRESSGGKSFTSGSIRSQGTVAFRYGRCEIRAKLTKQKGTWPAFWLMSTSGGWPDCGELDVFEQINGSDWIGGNMHIPDGAGATFSNSGLASTEDGTHWGDAFHRIGVIMTEFECVWYVDDHIFKRMDVRNKTRYPMTDGKSWYILLNLAFGGGWPGQTSADDASIAGFQSEDFEIDYCRIFTNTTAGNTVSRGLEPEVARLSGPVKATVWRGWQMKYGKAGANYFQNHLISEVGKHIKTAMREYFTRDGADIVTFLTRPDENTGSTNLANPFDVPGVSTLSLSPEAGGNYNATERDRREKLLTTVMFDRNRFSPSDSAIGSMALSSDAGFTNCCAVAAELVERETGAKVKVVSVSVIRTNGVEKAGGIVGSGFTSLMSKLGAMKNDKVILLLQGDSWSNWNYIDSRVGSELSASYARLGSYTSTWPAYQSAWATANFEASAENPAPLSVPKSNGQASGVHTNQAYCATVQFEAPPAPPAPQVVSASDAAGFDYTNRLVTVTGLAAGETVTLSTARAGTTTVLSATADANGEATFSVATAPGAAYSYAVSRDGTEVASGGFVTGGWKSGGSWFRGAFAAGAPVASGGSWVGAPRLASGGNAVAGDAQFALSAAARAAGSEKFARVEFDFKCEGMDDEVSLAADHAPMFGGVSTVALSAGGTAWFAWDGIAWHRLYGDAAPEVGGAYVVRAELDLAAAPKAVRYFVSSDGGGTFAPLFADAELADEWIACRAAPSDGIGEVAVEGSLELASVAGTLMGADIAEADGTGYESLADALAAGGTVTLLTNATWPTNAPVGTVAVDQGGFALQGVALDGSGHAVVPRGPSAIPGEGRINISLAQAAALGVATSGKSPAQIASALAENGANAIPRWQSYVLGLDPTDAAAKPKAAIAVSGGKVELSLVGIDVNATSGATVTYRVYRFGDLADIADAEPVGGDRAVSATAELQKGDSEPRMFYRLEINVKGY